MQPECLLSYSTEVAGDELSWVCSIYEGEDRILGSFSRQAHRKLILRNGV
jgi:hypothetical protein